MYVLSCYEDELVDPTMFHVDSNKGNNSNQTLNAGGFSIKCSGLNSNNCSDNEDTFYFRTPSNGQAITDISSLHTIPSIADGTYSNTLTLYNSDYDAIYDTWT